MTTKPTDEALNRAREIVLKHVPHEIKISHVNMDWLCDLQDEIAQALSAENKRTFQECKATIDGALEVARVVHEKALDAETEREKILREASNELQIICCRILADWTKSEDVYELRAAVDAVREALAKTKRSE